MQADALIGGIRVNRTQVSRLQVENRKEIKFSGFCSVSLDWFRQQNCPFQGNRTSGVIEKYISSQENNCKVTLPYSCFIFSLFPFSPLTHMAEYQRPDGSRHQHQQEVPHAAGQPLMAQ